MSDCSVWVNCCIRLADADLISGKETCRSAACQNLKQVITKSRLAALKAGIHCRPELSGQCLQGQKGHLKQLGVPPISATTTSILKMVNRASLNFPREGLRPGPHSLFLHHSSHFKCLISHIWGSDSYRKVPAVFTFLRQLTPW